MKARKRQFAAKPLGRRGVLRKRTGLEITAPWTLHESGGLQVLQLEPFCQFPWLVHGFSTRSGGVSELNGEKALNLSFMDWDERAHVEENRRRLRAALDAQDFRLAMLKQIHSDATQLYRKERVETCKGDASMTNDTGVLLAVQTADCVPILLVDSQKRAAAAIHAGWRGTLARIVEKAVGRMRQEFRTRPQDVLAAIGPSIGACCYEVGAEFVLKFSAQFTDAGDYFDEPRSGEEPNPLQWLNMAPPGHQPPPKNVHLDLRKANRSQLLWAGLRAQNIFDCNLCTACGTDLFFSYRKEGALSGRQLSVIGICSSGDGSV